MGIADNKKVLSRRSLSTFNFQLSTRKAFFVDLGIATVEQLNRDHIISRPAAAALLCFGRGGIVDKHSSSRDMMF
jgi:hypothetical protein